MRKNKLKLIISILAAVCIVLVACVAIIYIGKKTLDDKQAQITALNTEISSNKQIVYVAKTDIKAGETLMDGKNVMEQNIYTGLENKFYMGKSMLGSVAVVDIKKDAPIMANMITTLDVTKDTREYEIAVANLMTDQAEDDYVDVRIMMPTGEDYTILTRKCMKNLQLSNCVFFSYLNEDEIERMASATIDAYTIPGAYIYTTRYVEPSLQKDAVPDYLVKPETIDRINSDPNILDVAKNTLNVDARMNLENRLSGLSNDTFKKIEAGQKATAKSKNGKDSQTGEVAVDETTDGTTDETTDEATDGTDSYQGSTSSNSTEETEPATEETTEIGNSSTKGSHTEYKEVPVSDFQTTE